MVNIVYCPTGTDDQRLKCLHVFSTIKRKVKKKFCMANSMAGESPFRFVLPFSVFNNGRNQQCSQTEKHVKRICRITLLL